MTRRSSRSTRTKALASAVVTTFASVTGCGEVPEGNPPFIVTHPSWECEAPDSDTEQTSFVPAGEIAFERGEGFDLDHINNAPRGGAGGGSGPTLSGCGLEDAAYGEDDRVARAIAEIDDLVSIGPMVTLPLELRLVRLSTQDVATDPCVGVELRIGGASGTIVAGSGSMTDHVASVALGPSIAFDVPVTASAPTCGDASCDPATLAVVVRKPVAVFSFDATNTRLLVGSSLGGAVFFRTDEAGYEGSNGSGLAAALVSFGGDAGMSVSAIDSLIGGFEDHLDLRLDRSGNLVPCGIGSPPNAISFAISLAGADP